MKKRDKSNKSVSYGFVRLVLVRPFVEELKSRGIAYASTLEMLGLNADAVSDPTRYVHAETIYGVFNALAAAANDRHLGYHVGSKLDFATWPPFASAVRSARTVGEFMTEFISAVPSEANSVRHEMTVGSDGACYRIHRLIETKASPQHTEAFGVAVFIRLFQAITGNAWDPERVLIRTSYQAALPRRVQGIRVKSKSEGGLELHFPTKWLYEPIQLHSMFSHQHSSSTQLEQDVSLLNVFRSSAKTMLDDLNVGLTEIADAMSVTSAALEAALKSEGTSAAKELRRLRIEVAKSRLKSGPEKISSIAAGLGYSDPAHFSRFFRSQTGQSPREYRKAE